MLHSSSSSSTAASVHTPPEDISDSSDNETDAYASVVLIDKPEHRPAISSTLVALSRATSTPYVPPRFPTVPTGHFMYLALPS
jgi:hypothetical protein